MTPWYKNPVYWGLAIMFIVNGLQAIHPLVSGAVLVIVDFILAGLTAISHSGVVNTAIQSTKMSMIR